MLNARSGHGQLVALLSLHRCSFHNNVAKPMSTVVKAGFGCFILSFAQLLLNL